MVIRNEPFSLSRRERLQYARAMRTLALLVVAAFAVACSHNKAPATTSTTQPATTAPAKADDHDEKPEPAKAKPQAKGKDDDDDADDRARCDLVRATRSELADRGVDVRHAIPPIDPTRQRRKHFRRTLAIGAEL